MHRRQEETSRPRYRAASTSRREVFMHNSPSRNIEDAPSPPPNPPPSSPRSTLRYVQVRPPNQGGVGPKSELGCRGPVSGENARARGGMVHARTAVRSLRDGPSRLSLPSLF